MRRLTYILLILPCICLGQTQRTDPAETVAGMTLKEKAACVVGLKRDLFPPTNRGFAGRTTPFPEYGIPTLTLADGTAGLRLSRRGKERATAFPDNMALASSWNEALVREVGATAGFEARGYNANILLAPGMNIIRNPLCGRDFEYFSEDPYVTGKMGAAYVAGIQSNGVAASAKHFACNNQETNRTHNDVRVSERALREIYLKGFEMCVKEADPWTIMSSYNSLNGVPVQESSRLLTDILRNEWGFNGLVMTDWSISKHDTAAQLHAGNDLYMPGKEQQVEDIINGINDGSLRMEDLDRACINVLELGRRCGFKPSSENPDLKAGEAVSLKAACESSVLLENNGMLPLAEKGGKVALFGVRSYDLISTGGGSGFVVSPHIVQISEAFRAGGVEPDAKLEDLYTKFAAFAAADIKYNEKIKIDIGIPPLPELEISETLIKAAAEADDYAIITIGRSAEEGKDRNLENDYHLSDTEKKLITEVCNEFHKKGKKVAVILNIAGIIETESWKRLPDAILGIWLPGQEGGNAVFDLLSGRANPSGRLALTFPKDYFDLPTARNFPYDKPAEGQKNFDYTSYEEGIYVGYRHFYTRNVPVSYPFGYGLSYTTFEYPSLKVTRRKDRIKVSFTVKNAGNFEGKEAVGVYISAPGKDMDKPSKELKAFAKTNLLAPGETQTLEIEIAVRDLASFNGGTGKWEVEKGRYTIAIGADCSDAKATRTIIIP